MGDGGGCMIFNAVENTTRNVIKKARFANEVIQFMFTSHRPTCMSTPTMAKVSANLKRGSARKNPFQLAFIAHNESGRYVVQKTTPVRPSAADH